jgi:Ca2+/Na+ antiporter
VFGLEKCRFVGFVEEESEIFPCSSALRFLAVGFVFGCFFLWLFFVTSLFLFVSRALLWFWVVVLWTFFTSGCEKNDRNFPKERETDLQHTHLPASFEPITRMSCC